MIQQPCDTCSLCKYSFRKKRYYCYLFPYYTCDFNANENFLYERYCWDYELELRAARIKRMRRYRRIRWIFEKLGM